MKRGLMLLVALFMGLQLCVPVQAAEMEEAAQEEPKTTPSETEPTEEEPTLQTPEGEVPSEEEGALQEDSQPETGEEQPSDPETEPLPQQPAEPEEEPQTPEEENPVPEETTPADLPEDSGLEEESLPEEAEETPRLYNGYEADYEDPQFLKLLETGFFEDTGIAPIAEARVSHNSRFQNYTTHFGVDISKWNTISSWSTLAKSVDFVLIRCGNRTTSGGTLSKDPKFDEYMKAAQKAGLNVGVYIYSQAITEQEAREEAEFALELCEGYDFKLPIVIDYEYYNFGGRLYDAHLSNAERTNICRTFCEVIEAAGRPAMIYANLSMLTDDMDGESLAEAGYDIWMAHWVSSTNYGGTYTYWQYTDSAYVSGISGKVDANYWYELPEATISKAVSSTDGVHLSWTQVDAADQYVIYRKEDGASAWTKIGSVTGAETVSYLDETVEEGRYYRYTVQACDGAVGALYDRTGTLVYIEPEVHLNSATPLAEGVELTWDGTEDYNQYRIYRKTGTTGSWVGIATLSNGETSYVDKSVLQASSIGKVYSYTIRGFSQDGQSNYDTKGRQVTILATPDLTSVTARETSMLIQWKPVTDAQGYYVYRRQNNTWSRLATVTGAQTVSYQDNSASVSGTIYTYTVVAYHSIGRSDYDRTGVSAMQLAKPQLRSATTQEKGVLLSWTPAANAQSYRVYRKTGSNGWSLLASVSGGTSYLDQTAECGVPYTYTVRSVISNYLSAYDTKGVTTTRLATPALNTPTRASADAVKITWPAVSGAVQYRVYRKTAGTSWAALTNVTTNSYQDTSKLTNGTTYYYTVRAVNSSGQLSGYRTSGVAYTHLQTPTLQGTTAQANGIQVRWNAVPGATSYAIYRKTSSTGWSRVGTVGQVTSYVDTTPQSNTAYSYTVRAYGANSYSWYHLTGVSGRYVATPKLTAAGVGASGITVTWASVGGQDIRYVVYRKSGNSSWIRQAIVTGTKYTDTSAKDSGTVYTYTVRASVGSILSDYDRSGLSCTYLETPTLRTPALTQKGVQITWSKVPGATSYAVYRKTPGGGWVRQATVQTTSYTDTTAQSGTTYLYTVRGCVGSQMGYYDPEGVTQLYLSTPGAFAIYTVGGNLQVAWDQVEGATSYRVYRKTAGTNWIPLETVKETHFTDMTSQPGVSYVYTVRACEAGAMSSYSTTGISGSLF